MNGDCTDTNSARVTTQCIRQREAYDPCDNFRVDVDFISGGGKYSLGEVDSEGWSARQAKPKGSDDMKNAGSHSLNTKWKKKFSVKHNRYYWYDGKVSVWKIPTVEEGGQTETLKKVVPPSSGQDILSESKEGTAQGRMICCNGTGKYLRDETTNKERMFTNQVVNYEQHVEKEKGLRVMDSNIKERYHSCVTTVKCLNAPFTSPIKGHEDLQNQTVQLRVKKKKLSLEELRVQKEAKLKEDRGKWQPQLHQQQNPKPHNLMQPKDLKPGRGTELQSHEDVNIDSLVAGVEKLKLICTETTSSGGLSENPLAYRQRIGREALTSSEKRGYLLFDEYEAAVCAKLIPPYSGKAFKTPRSRYETGWAYNAQKKRWVKAAIQDVATSKRLMEAENVALKAEVQTMKTTLAQVVPGTQVAASDPKLAPNLLVLDTNILLAELANIHTLVDDLRKHPDVDATIIIPREVYHELDILKNKPGDTYRIRAAVRYLEELRSMQLKGRRYPYLRVQNDAELYHDNGHHVQPALLRGDDAIQNCCLWFSRITNRRVTLCSGDRIFRERALANGISIASADDIISVEIFGTKR